MTDRRPGRKKRRLIQGYWLAWIGANAVAWAVGFALAQAYARLLYPSDRFIESNLAEASYIWTRPLESPIASANFGLLLGVAIGLGQWLVLRRRFDIKLSWWVAATAAGFVLHGLLVGLDVNFITTNVEGELTRGSALGRVGLLCGGIFLVGIPQWLVLRSRYGQAGWWILASAVGLFFAAPDRSGGTDALAAWISVSLVAGVVYGLATAVSLALLTDPKKPSGQEASRE